MATKNIQGTLNVTETVKINSNDLMSNFAANYDSTATYAVGDLCNYQGKVYECSTDIAVAEAFDPTHWTEKKVSDLVGGAGPAPELCESITWAALKSLRDGGNLVPGKWYRITDYTCTTIQVDTQSAGHLFDILVVATDESHLSEDCFAAHHAGDTYFAYCDLESWELKYSLDNDASRFCWADTDGIVINNVIYIRCRNEDAPGNQHPFCWSNKLFSRAFTNSETPSAGDYVYSSYSSSSSMGTISSLHSEAGKGVIYHMKDEFNNEAPYDFKNIKVSFTSEGYTTKMYTFNVATSPNSDGSVATENRTYTYFYNNTIKPYFSQLGGQRSINAIVLNSSGVGSVANRKCCKSNYFDFDCYDIFIGKNNDGNISSDNFFGVSCHSMFLCSLTSCRFGRGCSGNTTTTTSRIDKLTMGDSCYNNAINIATNKRLIIGSGTHHCTFGGFTTGDYCLYTIGNNCSYIETATQNNFITIGDNCNYIKFGDASNAQNTAKNIVIENDCNYLYLNSTTLSSSLQNIKVAKGVCGSSSTNRKTITTADNNTTETTYVPAGSVITEV